MRACDDDEIGVGEAEKAAARWAEQFSRRYVGRHRRRPHTTPRPVITAQIMADLTAASAAHMRNDHTGYETAMQPALIALYEQLHDWDAVHHAIQVIEPQVDQEARIQHDLYVLGQARNPAELLGGLA